jgi:hypothetical protein
VVRSVFHKRFWNVTAFGSIDMGDVSFSEQVGGKRLPLEEDEVDAKRPRLLEQSDGGMQDLWASAQAVQADLLQVPFLRCKWCRIAAKYTSPSRDIAARDMAGQRYGASP